MESHLQRQKKFDMSHFLLMLRDEIVSSCKLKEERTIKSKTWQNYLFTINIMFALLL
jgi:hypothetical protein